MPNPEITEDSGRMQSSYDTDAEATEFLQSRVERFCYVAGAISLVGLAFRLGAGVLFGYIAEEIARPSIHFHAATLVPLLGAWLFLRQGPKSRRTLRAVDAVAVVGASFCAVAIGTTLPPESGAAPIAAFVATIAYIARAIYVPGSARRTLVIGLVIGVALVGAMYTHYLDANLTVWRGFGYTYTGRTPQTVASATALQSTMWWTFAMMLGVLATSVVHGLRREVHDVRRLGQYILEEKLGEGGMGVVYRATHGMLKRTTAIKLLRGQQRSAVALDRFRREVQLTASLTHPNTVTIYDYGRTPDGLFYYAMELLHGATLQEIVELDGPQPPHRVAHVLSDAARALHEAHTVGLVHRDVKPNNIMLSRLGGMNDVVKVLDFGLVKRLETNGEVTETQADSIKGTPQYIAPEAITDPDLVGPQSDIYALGAVGYYLLAGRPMFEGKTVIDVCSQHLHAVPKPLSAVCDVPIPAQLEDVLMRCVEKDPAKRPTNAAALAKDLDASVEADWTHTQADAWWERFQPTLSTLREKAARATTGQTIAVDLAER